MSTGRIHWAGIASVVAAIAIAAPPTAWGADAPASDAKPEAPVVVVTSVAVHHRSTPDEAMDPTKPEVSAYLRDSLVVQLGAGQRKALLAWAERRQATVDLLIDGKTLKGVSAEPHLGAEDALRFALVRTPENRATWAGILGGHLLRRSYWVAIAVSDRSVIAKAPARVGFALETDGSMWLLVVVVLLFLIAMFVVAAQSAVLRDKVPGATRSNKSSFSLGRTQMWWWTMQVVSAFLLIWGVTGAIDTVTPTALTLIGIGAGTALGAAAVDAGRHGKRANLEASLAGERAKVIAEKANVASNTAGTDARSAAEKRLAEAERAVAEGQKQLDSLAPAAVAATGGILADLLEDADGVSLHRLQMVVWTLVLTVLFWASVWSSLAMPDFDATLLALMGISAGTYVGFKIPERPA